MARVRFNFNLWLQADLKTNNFIEAGFKYLKSSKSF